MLTEQHITLAHGAGGGASAELLLQVFLPRLGQPEGPLQDSALLSINQECKPGDRLAFTTDSFVVSPIAFPGGDIGKLAVCGTVNDLAVAGATPKYLSASFILEEGLAIAALESIVDSMANTAREAGVKVVTGDTKVVPRGQVDKVYINTSGIGIAPAKTAVHSGQAKPGDVVLINGFIGDHGAAVMMARGELGLKADIQSDCAPLNTLVGQVLDVCPQLAVMRDATRGGVGAVLSEIANASQVTIAIDETTLPIRSQTAAICELLGMEPLFFANEGLAVFIVPEAFAEDVLQVMKSNPYGKEARVIGKVMGSSQGLLYVNTSFGSKRMLETPYGIQLPRIC